MRVNISVFLVVIIEKTLEGSWNVILGTVSRKNVLLIEYVKDEHSWIKNHHDCRRRT